MGCRYVRINSRSHVKFFGFIFFILCVSCTESTSHVVPEKIDPIVELNKDFLQILSSSDTSSIFDFYRFSGNKTLWLNNDLELNDRGKKLIDIISHAEDFGLFTHHYHLLDSIGQLEGISKDTALTKCFIEFAIDLKWGLLPMSFFKSRFSLPKYNKKQFIELIGKKINDLQIDDLLLECQPKHPQYLSIIKSLKKFNARSNRSRDYVKVPTQKQDSLKSYQKSIEALKIHGFIDSTYNNDSLLTLAIKDFQIEHGLNPDAVIGSNTSRLLSKSPFDYFLYAVTALEKWRKREEWRENRIEINIAGFELRHFKGNQETRRHKVIVGKKRTQTSEMMDSIEYLVVYPYWNVPSSIVFNELLPKARKDSTYFSRNSYEVLSGRNIVNSRSINYNASFPYKVRQKGGRSNALGLLKFIFPNTDHIYLHDTPSKALFDKDVRAFSHGCIRLQDPLDLASDLLDIDKNEYKIDTVKAIIKQRKRTRINLNNTLPIYIHYTMASGNNNSIVFHEDIYKKDEKLKLELMKISE